MRTRRILGASLTTLLTVGMVGAAMPTATAGDNTKSDYDGKRVVKVPDAADGPVQVLVGGGTIARNIGDDAWRVRVGSVPDGYSNSDFFPATVTRWLAETTPAGVNVGAYVDADGRLVPWSGTPGGSMPEPPVADPGPIVLATGHGSAALVANGDTWIQHFESDGTNTDAWRAYPDPNVDGVPGAEGQSFALTADGLLAFWNEPNGDLRVAHRPLRSPETPFTEPITLAPNESMVRLVNERSSHVLVTQATDGTVYAYDYDPEQPPFFTNKRELAPAGSQDAQVLVDRLLTVTVAWKEAGDDGGLVLRQLDRPRSSYLERPTLVPGTRRADARVVTSTRGTLTVALRRNSENAIVRVKHLPAGKTKWTNGVRLISPKPITGSSAGWDLGTPRPNGNLTLAVNDTVGVYAFRFDAPRPYTKVTRPVRKTQKVKTYRIKANTSWAFADNWEFRMRRDKGKRYGAWKTVAVAEGENSKVVTRPRGQKWCYQAKAFLGDRQVTKWSEQKCVSVRR